MDEKVIKGTTKYKKALKVACFLLIIGGMMWALTPIFKPLVYEWNENTDAATTFYAQPENSIETIFLGTSLTECSVSTLDLYEDYGLSAFNLGASRQPIAASYYWMLEAHDYNEETLTTVVMNVSFMVGDGNGTGYDYAFLSMKNSINKFNLAKDTSDGLDDFLAAMIPVFGYHTRWSSLDEDDFTYFGFDASISSRGYRYNAVQILNDKNYTNIDIPNYVVQQDEKENDVLDPSCTEYLVRMIEYCEENDLELILVQTPTDEWSDDMHFGMTEIATEYDVEFLDFNYAPLVDEIEYNVATNSSDMEHMNYYGASKYTAWLGEYLTENCDVTDVRGLDEYSYLETELAVYKEKILDITLDDTVDPYEYIQAVNEFENYSILITVQEDAATYLTEEQRENLASIGLTELANLEYQGAYIGVIENGEVAYESVLNAEEGEIVEEQISLTYRSILMDGTAYVLESTGGAELNWSSCEIGYYEYLKLECGINIVVYDNDTSTFVDRAVFDTNKASTREAANPSVALEDALANGATLEDLTGELKDLYLYNLRVEDVYTVALLKIEYETLTLSDYIDTFIESEDYMVFITTQGEAQYDANIQSMIEEMDLQEIEETDIVSSLMSSSTYSVSKEAGIKVVIYNKVTELLVDIRVFDAYTYQELEVISAVVVESEVE